MKNSYHAIGLMSGSSLDGVDMAHCFFHLENGNWTYEIQKASCIEYPAHWIQKLQTIRNANGRNLWQTHTALGSYFGEITNAFISENNIADNIDFIASHGHTVFHFPEENFTCQIGDGAALSAITKLPVVCDFRSADIAFKGQGTPIVPVGDKLLFGDYRFLLNMGGICNISAKVDDKIIAFDIAATNQVLNFYAAQLGKPFDENGNIAQSGSFDIALFEELNQRQFYQLSYPKSLDNGFSQELIIPVIEQFEISVADKLNTYTEHIAFQINQHLQQLAVTEKTQVTQHDKMLVTGGGAFNSYLLERIKDHCNCKIVVPSDEVVKFKEALVIAFMGVLRMRNEVNVYSSVTGADTDTVGGAIYHAIAKNN